MQTKEFTPEQWVDLVTAIRQALADSPVTSGSDTGAKGNACARALFMAASDLGTWDRRMFFHEVARRLGAFVARECLPDGFHIGNTPSWGEYGSSLVAGADSAEIKGHLGIKARPGVDVIAGMLESILAPHEEDQAQSTAAEEAGDGALDGCVMEMCHDRCEGCEICTD